MQVEEPAPSLLSRAVVTKRKHEGFKMRHTVLVTKVLIGMLTVLGTLPAAAGGLTMEKRYRDEEKFKKRFELERAADKASQANRLARENEIVHIVPKEPLMSQYLNSEAGTHPDMAEDKGLTVRQAMERRLARFEAALEEARKYRKGLPMNPPEGVTERVAIDGRVDSKINYEAFRKATLRAAAEYEAFDHYKTKAQATFRTALGDLYEVPGERRVFMGSGSQSMSGFFDSYRAGFVDPLDLPNTEKVFSRISEIEHHLKRNGHGGTSRMSTVLGQQLSTLQSAEKNGVRVYAGNMHVPASSDTPRSIQSIGLRFQSALKGAKELRTKSGGTGPVTVFVTAATVFSSTAALAGEAEALPESGDSSERSNFAGKAWARPHLTSK